MLTKNSSISVAVAACALMLSTSAIATNGYLTHGLGTKNKGMAGAGTAAPNETMSVVNNPAGPCEPATAKATSPSPTTSCWLTSSLRRWWKNISLSVLPANQAVAMSLVCPLCTHLKKA